MKPILLCLFAFVSCPYLLSAQNVGINQASPQSQLHITNAGGNTLTVENSQILSAGAENQIHFKSGPWFTAGIRSIGSSSTTARLGFFTKAHLFSSQLLERMTITDDGKVGINNTAPAAALDVNGTLNVGSGTTMNAVTLTTLKITGGQPGVGKVLTSDIQGNATWKKINEGTTHKLIIPALSFRGFSSTSFYYNGAPGITYPINTAAGGPKLEAPVTLPEGAVVKKMTVVCYLNHSAINGIWTSLNYATYSNGAITYTKVHEFLNSDELNPNIQKVSSPAFNHVVANADRTYWVRVYLYSAGLWQADNSLIFWIELEYDL